MKIISHAKLTKSYEHWKQAFDENESLRQEYGVTVLAYGHPKAVSYTHLTLPTILLV